MGLARVKYGIEFDPGRGGRGPVSKGWIAVAAVVATALAAVMFVMRLISSPDGGGDGAAPIAIGVAPQPAQPQAPRDAERIAAQERKDEKPPAPQPPETVKIKDFAQRPARVRNLLLRLDGAAKRGDAGMQAATIYQLLAMPDAADLADTLVPRLGRLNMCLLFDEHDRRWVSETTVKNGDSATRIAQEHGSTLASMAKLNGWTNADILRAGSRVKVLNHPKFNIVVHKKLRAVDLFLGGKLFKRYDMPEGSPGVKWPPGDYKTPANLRDFLNKMGATLRTEDAAEIGMLVPRDTPLNITAS